jgi:hypothetical protein
MSSEKKNIIAVVMQKKNRANTPTAMSKQISTE